MTDQEKQDAICGYVARYMIDQVEALECGVGGELGGGDGETIHSIRIASRRLMNSLRLFSACITGEQVTKWQDEISRITRTLSGARDLDIQIDFINQVYKSPLDIRFKPGYRRLILRLNKKRSKVQEKVVKSLHKLQEEDILSGLREQLDTPAAGGGDISTPATALFEEASSSISQELDDFLSYQPYIHSPDNADKLHAMRIAGKNLRYTMEVFAPIYRHALQPHLKILKNLQEELGEFHDNDVWVTWLPKFIEEEHTRINDYYGDDSPFQQLLPGLHHLIEDRRKAREETHRSFLSTWEILTGENAWQVLMDILRSPLADGTARERLDMDGEVQSEVPEQEDSQAYIEFEVELTPEDLGDHPGLPDQENPAEES